jgi:hypothetical protein
VAVLAICSVLAVVLVAGGPVEAASKPKKAPKPKQVSGVWVGQLERHGKHWDYVGRGCPLEAQVCTASITRYRINPTTAQARDALAHFTGGSGGVWGDLKKAHDHGHQGMLKARQISAADGSVPTLGTPGVPGGTGFASQGDTGGNSNSAPDNPTTN